MNNSDREALDAMGRMSELVSKVKAADIELYETIRADFRRYYAEETRRRDVVKASLRDALVAEFVDNWDIRDPGTLANNTADAILNIVLKLLADETLTRINPISTETKVEI